jgi:hypothetical protein
MFRLGRRSPSRAPNVRAVFLSGYDQYTRFLVPIFNNRCMGREAETAKPLILLALPTGIEPVFQP